MILATAIPQPLKNANMNYTISAKIETTEHHITIRLIGKISSMWTRSKEQGQYLSVTLKQRSRSKFSMWP